MNSLKGALCASLFFISFALADLPLVGVSWQSPSELTAIAALSEQVRYVARGVAFVEASESAVEAFTKRGFAILCLDRPRAGDRYFVADHLRFPLPQGIELVFDGGGEWALLRVGQKARLHEAPHFLWPLPTNYSLDGWLGTPRRAPKAVQTASPAVAALIEEVAAERLQAHVEALALKDPALGSVPGNLRSRFTVHPEIVESTEYIRSQLAAALGDAAVELHSFPIDSERVTSHTSRRGNEGHTPTDTTAYNVIGTLPGTDPAAGYYIICAHYDATGVRSAGGWDWQRDPAPGADDNASGVALVLESARLLAGQQFPWAIRFIAWSGEELGLLGSQAYADLAAERDDNILGVLNFDMIGFNDLQQRLELVTNPGSQWLAAELGAAAERYGIGLAIDVFEDAGSRISDHAPFWRQGYDAIVGIENHLPADPTSYGVREGVYRINSQYHTVLDLPDSLNWELIRRTTQLAVATLAQYGVGEGLPNLAVFTGDLRGDRDGRSPRQRQQHRAGRGRQRLLGASFAMCAGFHRVRGHSPRTGPRGLSSRRERGSAHSLAAVWRDGLFDRGRCRRASRRGQRGGQPRLSAPAPNATVEDRDLSQPLPQRQRSRTPLQRCAPEGRGAGLWASGRSGVGSN